MMKRNIFTAVGASLMLVTSFWLGVTPSVNAAVGQSCTWTGTAGDNKFSTATNWSDCAGLAPAEGNIIRFATRPNSDTALTNDLGVSFSGLSNAPSLYATGHGKYTIDTLSFTDGAVANVETTAEECTGPVPVLVTSIVGAGALTVNNSAIALYDGISPSSLVIAGALTVTGSSYAQFSSGSSAASVTVASPAPFGPACQSGVGSMAGSDDSFAGLTYASLTVEKGAGVVLSNMSKPMTLGGGTGNSNPIVSFYADYMNNGNVATTRTWSGSVSLLSNVDVTVDDDTTVNYTGVLSGSGFSLLKTSYSTGKFNNNASSNTSSTPSGAQNNPIVTTELADKNATWLTIIPNETVVFKDAEREGVSVLKGATLKGSGVITVGLYVNDGAVIAPGYSPGCITTGNIGLAGEYQFELGGSVPCSGYDQIKTTFMSGGSPVTFDTKAILSTSRYNGYTPKQGDVFVIINQAGIQAVNGTFKGLAEGATFEQNGIVFKISYVGGDGNDVTLTVQNTPKAPNTGFMLVKANPVVSAAVAVAAALALVVLGRKLRPSRR